MKNLIKLIITIVLFYYLSRLIDFDKLQKIVLQGHLEWIILALFFQLSSTFVAAYRWFKISKLINLTENLSFYIQSYFKGTFFNQVLPSSIGGDAVKIYDLIKKGYNKKDAFYDVFVDRVIGLVGLLILNLFSTILFFGTFSNDFSLLIIFITLSGIGGFLFLFHLEKITFLGKYKFLDLFHRLARRLNKLYASNKILMQHLAISIAVHILSVLAMFSLSLSIDLNIDFEVLLIAIPPVFLLTIVPISLAGWGIREGAMVGILMLVGADQTKVLAMSILYGLLLILSAIPGAFFWVKGRKN